MRRSATALAVVLLAGAAVFVRVAAAQPSVSLKIMSPTDGATVSGPVTLQVEINGGTVKPAEQGDPQAFHYHVLVDVDPATVIQAGQPIPTGQANIIHTADLRLALANLSPGQHTVTVILTRTDHVPLSPGIEDRVRFTVAAAAPAQAQASPAAAAAQQPTQAAQPVPVAIARTGRGGPGPADGAVSTSAVVALAGLVLLMGAAAGRMRARARGSCRDALSDLQRR